MAHIFNKKKHSDIVVTVSGGEEDQFQEETFFLHKFPLISKSLYFDEHIPEQTDGALPLELKISEFPGGPRTFETVAKYCYGIDIELTTDDIAHIYCGARFLRIPDLEKSTASFMDEVVLRDIVKSARVLKVATGIAHMTEEMLSGVVGHCIQAIASMFEPIPELFPIPADCFACIVRTAKEMASDKKVLEDAVIAYLEAHIKEENVELGIDEFIEVVSAPGRMEDMRYCESLYNYLEILLREFGKEEENVDKLCKQLHNLGFWVCLPHVVIERAYGDRYIPDRYVTVALMAENRHLLKVNEQLATQVEQLTDALRNEAGLQDTNYPSQAVEDEYRENSTHFSPSKGGRQAFPYHSGADRSPNKYGNNGIA